MMNQFDPYGRRRSQAANPFTDQPQTLALSRAFGPMGMQSPASPLDPPSQQVGGVAPFATGNFTPQTFGGGPPNDSTPTPWNPPRPTATPPPPPPVGGTPGVTPTGQPQPGQSAQDLAMGAMGNPAASPFSAGKTKDMTGVVQGTGDPLGGSGFRNLPPTGYSPWDPTIPLSSQLPSSSAASGGGQYSNLPGFDQINGWYQQFLGHPATLQDYYAHTTGGRTTGPTNLLTALHSISSSPEAQAFAAQTSAPAPTAAAAPPAAPAPAATTLPAAAHPGSAQAPAGWDQGKWDDPNKHDPKYDYGHIASGYAEGGITPDEMPLIFAEVKKLYPNATWDGRDAIDFGDGYGPIDVVTAYSTGHGQPGWIPASDSGSPAAGGGHGSDWQGLTNPGGSGPNPQSFLGDTGYSQRILQYLMSQLGLTNAFTGANPVPGTR